MHFLVMFFYHPKRKRSLPVYDSLNVNMELLQVLVNVIERFFKSEAPVMTNF